MTLRHLEIFSAVCVQESFTRAAEQLNMAQPAVSLAIRELEVFYNVRLFERMNRRVYLTEAGRTLRQYADTVLSQFQESVEILPGERHPGGLPLRRPRDAGRDPPCGYPGASGRGAA